jgi:hypothetical protein
MKTLVSKRVRITAVAAMVVALSLAVGLPVLRAADPPLVVVVAAASPMKDISRGNLRRAFLGEPTGGPGGKLVPLNQPPGTPARGEFDRVVLGLEPDDVARFWIDQRIRGLGSAPRAFPAALIARVVPQLPGAIGYVRTNEVVPGIKVITIDGKKPGNAGYLLP